MASLTVNSENWYMFLYNGTQSQDMRMESISKEVLISCHLEILSICTARVCNMKLASQLLALHCPYKVFEDCELRKMIDPESPLNSQGNEEEWCLSLLSLISRRGPQVPHCLALFCNLTGIDRYRDHFRKIFKDKGLTIIEANHEITQLVRTQGSGTNYVGFITIATYKPEDQCIELEAPSGHPKISLQHNGLRQHSENCSLLDTNQNESSSKNTQQINQSLTAGLKKDGDTILEIGSSGPDPPTCVSNRKENPKQQCSKMTKVKVICRTLLFVAALILLIYMLVPKSLVERNKETNDFANFESSTNPTTAKPIQSDNDMAVIPNSSLLISTDLETSSTKKSKILSTFENENYTDRINTNYSTLAGLYQTVSWGESSKTNYPNTTPLPSQPHFSTELTLNATETTAPVTSTKTGVRVRKPTASRKMPDITVQKIKFERRSEFSEQNKLVKICDKYYKNHVVINILDPYEMDGCTMDCGERVALLTISHHPFPENVQQFVNQTPNLEQLEVIGGDMCGMEGGLLSDSQSIPKSVMLGKLKSLKLEESSSPQNSPSYCTQFIASLAMNYYPSLGRLVVQGIALGVPNRVPFKRLLKKFQRSVTEIYFINVDVTDKDFFDFVDIPPNISLLVFQPQRPTSRMAAKIAQNIRTLHSGIRSGRTKFETNAAELDSSFVLFG